MRTPEHLSHSGFSLWEKNAEEYYIKHLADRRAPHMPQERPASVGSCFDAFAKSALHEALFGKGADPEYSFESLFATQVEPHNRDWVLEEGRHVFQCYQDAGAYQELLDLLLQADEPPRFEFTVRAPLGGVPFLGKPDCRFVWRGVHIVHDWKVNGYCAKSAVSPAKGYMLCRDGSMNGKWSKSHNTAHKDFVAIDVNGLKVDAGYMEDFATSWADQLSLYGWGLGEKVGDQNVVLSIHQVACKPMPGGRPWLRFSEYRARVRDSYQHHLMKRLQTAWHHITSGHVLKHLSPEDNNTRCRMLEKESESLYMSDGSEREEFFNDCVRHKYRG